MPGAEWLALLGKHIPDRYEHLVRHMAWPAHASLALTDHPVPDIA